MPVTRLKQYLEQSAVKFDTIMHASSYTAQETAESAHIPGSRLAKTVMVKLDGRMAMAVLPACEQLDLELLRGAVEAHSAVLAGEDEFRNLFPQCELGAMPPFGNLYGMEVFMEQDLTRDEVLAFNAGTHSELVQLSLRDYMRLVNPRVQKLSTRYACQ